MVRKANNARNRKLITFAWITALGILTIFLIYRELTAILYILATLGVTALLIIVALADLSKHEKSSLVSTHADDATSIGSSLRSSSRTGQR